MTVEPKNFSLLPRGLSWPVGLVFLWMAVSLSFRNPATAEETAEADAKTTSEIPSEVAPGADSDVGANQETNLMQEAADATESLTSGDAETYPKPETSPGTSDEEASPDASHDAAGNAPDDAGDDASDDGSPETSDARPARVVRRGPVYVMPIEGEIEAALYQVMNRALRKAEREGASAFVLRMHTPGGRVDSAMLMRDRLIETDIPTYTYVDNMAISAGAFIALATEKIIMARGSNIGGALAIHASPTGEVTAVDAKFRSIFTSEMRKTAKFNGHSPDIAEAFTNPDFELEGIKKKGEILTLDYDDAVRVGLAAYISPTLEDMLETEGLGGVPIEVFRITTIDRIARWFSSSQILGLLMLIGLGGIYLEIRTPGVGLPGIVGITALMLFFFGSHLANLSDYMELIFFAIGLGLIMAEVFIIPGFGVAGIAGILLVVGSLFFAMFEMAPAGLEATRFTISYQRVRAPLWTLLISLSSTVPVFWLMGRLIRYTPVYGTLSLQPPERSPAAEAEREAVAVASELRGREIGPGQVGVALSELRPGGTALFDGKRTDVVTQGEFIEKDSPIEVARVEGHKVIVRAAG